MSFASAADSSFYSDAITYFNGSKINLNTGSSSLVPQEVKPLPVVAHTDTLNDATKGWAAAPGKLLSIVSRAPAHAPWASANQGVDVKVNNNASAALPSAPSPAVAAANNSAGAPTSPVSAAVASTVPVTGAISKALDTNTTAAIIADTAKRAAEGEAASAVKLGAGIVETATGPVGVVGATAQTFGQMEVNQIIKPGTAAYANSLVQSGKTVQQALTPNMFTGKDGITNLNSYINNPVAQVAGAVVGLKIAQKALTTTGLITGKESGTAIAGLVMSAATAGIQNTVNLVSNAASAVAGAVNGAVSNVVGAATGALNSVLGSANSLMSAGNFAGNLASTVTGGLSSIATSLTGMAKGAVAGISGLLDSAKGVAGSAFAAITGAFPTLQVGVPQNIKDITEKAQAAAQAPASNPLTGALNSVTGAVAGAVAGVTGALNNAVGSVAGVTGALNNAVGSATGILGAVTGVTGAVTGAINTAVGAATGLINNTLNVKGISTNLSTGLGSLPGGDQMVASVVNNAVGAINSVPGVSAVSGLINTASSITNGIAGLATNPLASSGALTAAAGAVGTLTKGLDDLKSGKLSLASLASAGLPAGAASQLNAAISAMSSGGAVQIKLPTVAINTTDRGELAQSITSLLGNSKIPAPNFAGISEDTYKSEIAKLDAKKEKFKEFDVRFDAVIAESKTVKAQFNAAVDAHEEAMNSLPAGDPGIDAALQKAKALRLQLTELQIKGYDILSERNKLSLS
jgi:hypothetical protein